MGFPLRGYAWKTRTKQSSSWPFVGMIIDRISQAQLSLTQWGKDCVRIDNQMPLTQENYDPKGILTGKATLELGYHNYCK